MSIIEEEEYSTITWIDTNKDWEWYYYVPLLDRKEWDGIEYDNIQYGWDELDYRFGVEYDSAIPEPSVTSLLIGLAIFGIILYKKLK